MVCTVTIIVIQRVDVRVNWQIWPVSELNITVDMSGRE